MLMIFALLILPLAIALGVATTDVSMWQSERRGAQKDADFSALAGAYELLNTNQSEEDARNAAIEYAAVNDESGNASIIEPIMVDNTCFNSDVLDSVIVRIEHESRTFFAGIIGLSAPSISAHARACMGSPIEGRGLIPLGVQVSGFDSECFQENPDDPDGPQIPIFGQYCRLAFGGSDMTSGEGGFLRLYDDGSISCSDPTAGGNVQVRDEISEGGADTTCYVAPPNPDCYQVPDDWPYGDEVNYCVWAQTGTFNKPLQQSFNELLSGEGECDSSPWGNKDGKDDWLEVVEAVNGDPNPDPGTTTFARRDCESPRLVTLVIIESFTDAGNDPSPILAFASFYIDACELDGVLYDTCDIQGEGLGTTNLYGFFMNILEVGQIGAANDFGQRAIALWE